ncbi:nitrilase/amidohydrolase superfamily protein, class 7 [Syntrophotalea carbinolica DSM 2380]|uniref:Nitrilase/amidohydrolase superfamily protein, class 7 n=1 Tax=Syntrophotalea carbinolica (strain DSM 2380 / NBRC 103641 / GraBd1) TaxID=338963 RepID=Q3A0A3_SYNC1|nr:nitrilase family protein [Syntrophotalea carbinolica]ABA90204.1 nitrilase/amidohydrolase superfamily protein, class 7 [Syntrophotalea carbinolica DSM 2380]
MTENGLSDLGAFRLALVQSVSEIGDCTRNLEGIARWTEQAARQGAEMVCFPELAICGYTRSGIGELAEVVPGRASCHLAALARKHRMVVSAGLIEKSGSACYITQLVASADGSIERYRKTHLGRREREVFCAGDALPVFTTRSRAGMPITFAIGLCYDLHFPELATAYAVQGAQLLLAPHAAPHAGPDRMQLWQRYMGARAYDNTMYVAACNHVQKLKSSDCSGGLGVWDYRTGTLLAQRTEPGEGLLFWDLDLDGVNRTRAQGRTFFLDDRRPELFR